MSDLIEQTLGDRYTIKSVLGKQRGRRTFLAVDSQTSEKVVLKLVLFDPDFTWEDLKLFEREAETLKSLNHTAIPKYLDSFEVETELGKGFVLVQTFIEARSLQEHMTSGRRFSEADIKAIAQSILTILQYLHSRYPPVIHRDIKPSNILLGDRTAHSPGNVYLVDFGSVQVAQHGGTMTVVGTYGYMPPEQFGGRAFPTSDLYSLGATLVYLASGQHPAEFEPSHLVLSAKSLALSTSFTHWLQQLLQPESHKRTASAALAFHYLTHAEEVAQQPSQPVPTSLLRSNKSAPKVSAARRKDASAIANRPIAQQAFKIRTYSNTLAIQFYSVRIRDKLNIETPTLAQRPSTSGGLKRFYIFVILATITSFIFALGVTSSSALGFILGVVCVALCIITFSLLFPSSEDHASLANLTLVRSQDGKTRLTLSIAQTEHQSELEETTQSPLKTQFKNIPIRTVKAISAPFGYSALFVFSNDAPVWKTDLSVGGSKEEIKELLSAIEQWNSSIVQTTFL